MGFSNTLYTHWHLRLIPNPRGEIRSDNIASLPLPFYASISRLSDDQIQLHSWVKEYQVPDECKSLFWETILQCNNPSLGRHLCCDDDGTWIWQGLCSGTLLIIHNGSYMREVLPNICSAAVMIWCTNTGKTCKCTIAKYSESPSSYRGEILGAIITQLILSAVVKGQMGSSHHGGLWQQRSSAAWQYSFPTTICIAKTVWCSTSYEKAHFMPTFCHQISLCSITHRWYQGLEWVHHKRMHEYKSWWSCQEGPHPCPCNQWILCWDLFPWWFCDHNGRMKDNRT